MFTEASFGNYHFIHNIPLKEGGNLYHRKHMHPEYELIFIAGGEVQYQVELEHYDLRACALLIIRPGEHHYPVFPREHSYEFYVIRFDSQDLPPAVRARLSGLSVRYDLTGTGMPPYFRSIGEQWEMLSEEPELLQESLKAILNQILITLAVQKGETGKTVFASESFRRIFEYVDRNYLLVHKLSDLERALNMSSSGISKSFLRQMEVPVMQYIRNRKTVHAHSLLLQGLPPAEAAERSGFEDYSAFYRNYVKIYGLSPRNGLPAVSASQKGEANE